MIHAYCALVSQSTVFLATWHMSHCPSCSRSLFSWCLPSILSFSDSFVHQNLQTTYGHNFKKRSLSKWIALQHLQNLQIPAAFFSHHISMQLLPILHLMTEFWGLSTHYSHLVSLDRFPLSVWWCEEDNDKLVRAQEDDSTWSWGYVAGM